MKSMWALLIAGSVAFGAGMVMRAVSGGGSGGADPAARHPTSTGPAGDAPQYSSSGYDITPIPPWRAEELAKGLTDEEKHILLRKGTERPFCGLLLDTKEAGVYTCRLCGLPLFSSESKFHSGTGWPSFFQPVDKDHVYYEHDFSHGMSRTEIMCQRCRGHLGHVFDDGPPPTGKRYCLNSGSLTFHKTGAPLPPESKPVPGRGAYK